MEKRPFGASGLSVPALGFGAGRIGDPASLSDADAERLLNEALDLGLALIDTAPSYGLSEERVGRFVGHRRGEFFLATKCGYGAPGLPDWTPECVAANIDAALRRLRTDHLDAMLLHSKDLSREEMEPLAEALERAREAGKIRAAGYSGEGETLGLAVSSGLFGAVETSASLCDQRSMNGAIPEAARRGLGVIAKRPLANAPWRHAEKPDAPDDAARAYWDRWSALDLGSAGIDWSEAALRFAAFAPGVSCAIAGTASLERLRANAAAVEKGPLPEDLAEAIRGRFREVGSDWPGLI